MTVKLLPRLFICILLAVIIILVIVFARSISRRSLKSFRIYYDKIHPMILHDMSNYDVNIVEASFFTQQDVEFIHLKESQVIGYLSLIEIGHWDTPLVNDLREEDYLLDESQQKMKSLSKTNYLGDLSSPHYREILFKYLEIRILDKGMDGVFFDTLDWIDYYAGNTRLYDKLASSYNEFLIELRQRYPNIVVIQNRGFDSFTKFSHTLIDGILWENFKSPYPTDDKDKIEALKKFQKIAKANKTDVYVISFENEQENRKIAEKLHWNFLYSQMENRYSEWDILVR